MNFTKLFLRWLLVKAYEQQSLYQEALNHLKQYLVLKLKLHGERHYTRIEALQVQHEIEKTRQIALVERELNEELQRANRELADANLQNQELLEQVQYQVRHDPLTGLPNRTLFEDRLQQAIAYAGRYNLIFAVMFIDLDGFKLVNDTLGHHAGDELLIQVAARFKTALRESDTISRRGGDEFTVIANNLKVSSDASVVARKLILSLESPFEIYNQKVSISASLGISMYPKDARDVFTLQINADTAMYHVKHRGKRDVAFYSPDMNQRENLTTVTPLLSC